MKFEQRDTFNSFFSATTHCDKDCGPHKHKHNTRSCALACTCQFSCQPKHKLTFLKIAPYFFLICEGEESSQSTKHAIKNNHNIFLYEGHNPRHIL